MYEVFCLTEGETRKVTLIFLFSFKIIELDFMKSNSWKGISEKFRKDKS